MAKLSKREAAARKAGGVLNYKTGKISVPVKQAVSKSIVPLAGAGPLQTGQSRVPNSYGGGSVLQGAGPLLPGQTREEGSYTGGGTRAKASQGKLPTAVFQSSFADAKSQQASPKPAETITHGEAPKGISGAFNALGRMWANYGLNRADPGVYNSSQQFLGQGYLSNGVASNGKLDQPFEGVSYGAPMSEEENILNQLLGINTAQASDLPPQVDFGQNFTPASSFQNSFASGGLALDPGYSMPKVLQPSIQQETVGTNQPEKPRVSQVQNPGGSRQGGVSQQYAQGATGGNPLMDYYKSQNKYFSAQEKAQKKALNELIKSIQNQYSTKQTEGIGELNKAKQEDLLKLSGLFSFANQDPNSEQRIQYEQRANQDYANQQTDFLAKLAAALSGDISQAQQGYQGKLADIAQQRNASRLEIAKLQQAAQEAALNRASRGGVSPKTSSPRYTPAYNNDGQIIGTYTIGNDGKTTFVPADKPFQARSKSTNPMADFINQMTGGGTPAPASNQSQGGTWETLPDGSRVWVVG